MAAVPGTPMDGLVIEPGATAPETGPPAEGHAVPGRPDAGPPGGGAPGPPGGGATAADRDEGQAVTGWPDGPMPGGPSGSPWDHGAPGPAGPLWGRPFPGAPVGGPEGARAGSGWGAMPQVSQYPSTTVPAHPGCVHLVIRPLRSE
ncbi:hypothetical protein ACOZ38_18380 [Sphaerisporangium viridialbum]|uniref:hypothetical protein n=1 Tax=Sphaerisporangium viridialbum TaxID=46189 RepID=UPI003C72A350